MARAGVPGLSVSVQPLTLMGIGSCRLSNDMPNSGLSWAMIGVAAVPAATADTGYCPLYQLLGIDSTF